MKRAIVVGGSMAGLFAALGLRRAGFETLVFEAGERPLAGRGAGIVTHDRLLAALGRVGISLPDNLGVAVEARRTLAADGSILAELAFPQINTSWDRLFRLLRGALPADAYRPGMRLVAAQSEAGAAVAHFADGTTLAADLIIGADGIRSTLRELLLPAAKPRYAGYVAWRGMVEESVLEPATRAALFEHLTFGMPPGENFVGYLVAGPDDDMRPGRRRYNFVWYRPADAASALPRLLTDSVGVRHETSIPPPLIAPQAIAEMRADAERLLAPVFREVVARTAEPFLQPIFDLDVERMAFGRIALIGDAAFVARPHVGAGVTKAAEDAVALADCLTAGADIEAGLRAFETGRLAIDRCIVQQGRNLGAGLQPGALSAAEQAAAAAYSTPHAVMRDFASLSFLDAVGEVSWPLSGKHQARA